MVRCGTLYISMRLTPKKDLAQSSQRRQLHFSDLQQSGLTSLPILVWSAHLTHTA